MAISYKDSGVDVERGYKAVELMKKHVKTTFNENVLGDIGSFGGFYSIAGEKMEEPVLVAGTDGVGTKLKYAFLANKHDTVGIDAVAMCVNDIVCQGAKPLFFLDYFATGKLSPETVATVVSGIAEGCRQSGCALIGGETAEMPGFYPDGEYDLAGFAVGIVDKKDVINGKTIKEGDALVGIASSGIHSNGYSLVRRLFGDNAHSHDLDRYDDRLKDKILNVLLTPTNMRLALLLIFVIPRLRVNIGADLVPIHPLFLHAFAAEIHFIRNAFFPRKVFIFGHLRYFQNRIRMVVFHSRKIAHGSRGLFSIFRIHIKHSAVIIPFSNVPTLCYYFIISLHFFISCIFLDRSYLYIERLKTKINVLKKILAEKFSPAYVGDRKIVTAAPFC